MHKVWPAVAGLSLIFIVPLMLRWIVTRGGKPAQVRDRYVYKLRPAMSSFSYGLILLGGYLCYKAITELWKAEMTGGAWAAIFAPICISGGLYMLCCYFVVDDEGLHGYWWLGKHVVIRWHDLDHYETMYNARAASNAYFFRPIEGRSLRIDDIGYNVDDMLRRIEERKKLKLEPYKRRAWYGG